MTKPGSSPGFLLSEFFFEIVFKQEGIEEFFYHGLSFLWQLGDALSFFSSPEGRMAKNGNNLEYQYAISDHQGNTRVLFSSVTPTPTVITATFEGDSNDNSNKFTNVVAGNVVSFTGANHTSGGSKVVRLNQAYRVGPSKSLKVYPGDKVDMPARRPRALKL